MARHFLFAAALAALAAPPAFALVPQSWVAKYSDPSSNNDQGNDVVLLPGGDTVVAGFCAPSTYPSSERDFLTIRYDAQGNQVWARRFNGPDGGHDEIYECAVDSAGNILVGGITETSTPGNFSYTTIKYSPGGQVLWVRHWSQGWISWDDFAGLAVDGADNVYVAGSVNYQSTGGSPDMALIAYGTGGALKWTAFYDGPSSGWDEVHDVTVDATGNSYLVGFSSDSTGMPCTTVKVDSTGTFQWVARESAGQGDRVTVDSHGTVFVAGREWTGSTTGNDVLALAYDPAGNRLWRTLVAGPSNYDDRPGAIRAGPAGDVFIAAQTRYPFAPPSNSSLLLLRMGPGGDLLWSRTWGAGSSDKVPREMVVDEAGNSYVTGENSSSGTMGSWSRYFTIKYAPDGSECWVISYGTPIGGPPPEPHAWARALALSDDGGHLIVTGADGWNCTTIRYDQAPPPLVYCTSKASSIPGCTPSLGGPSSLASVSSGAGSYTTVCAPVPGGSQPGLSFYTTKGPLGTPISNAFGWLCITTGPGLLRLPPRGFPGGTAGQCDGMYLFDLGDYLATQTINPALVPGARMDLQWWYRDPANPGTANFSNALSVQLVP